MAAETFSLYQQSQPTPKGHSCGVDFPPLNTHFNRTGHPLRTHVGLPNVSEPVVVRHYTRLSQQNFAIDSHFYPLGSCTMKHNPRQNENFARLPGFAHLHPLQPENTVQGALQLMWQVQQWLKELTGLNAVSLAPAAGAHGEFSGLLTIKAALQQQGEARNLVLIPDSAHGTNPATASMCGYTTLTIPSTPEGFVDIPAFEAAIATHKKSIAAFMLTNPNTCGLFEPNIKHIANKLHSIGAYFYCDGANFNAIMGKVKMADLGVDVLQFNLHKTFATPHGGGGPGCGPIAVSAALAPFLPSPHISQNAKGSFCVETPAHSCGRTKGFHGHFGMMVRALAYMQSLGGEGLTQASEDAVLNANYVLHHLKNHYHVPYPGFCMHECLLSDKKQKATTGATTLDIAKGLLDQGFHPMTIYFPLVVSGAMLIEPTESETKQTLDAFIQAMIHLAHSPVEHLKQAPQHQARKRLDEVAAARRPVLVQPPETSTHQRKPTP